MKKYKVICLEAGAGEVVKAEIIEKTINDMITKGWSLSKISTGGYGGGAYINSWVYLVFER